MREEKGHATPPTSRQAIKGDIPSLEGRRSLRVLFDIVEGGQVWGGLEEHMCVLGRHLYALGHEPLFLRRGDLAADKLDRIAAANIRLLKVPEIAVVGDIRPSLQQWVPAYRRTVRQECVDIVHLHSNLHGNELWTALAARTAGRAGIICTYHFPLGHESVRRRMGMWGMHRLLDVHGIAVSSEVEAMVYAHYRPAATHLTRIFNGVDRVPDYIPLVRSGAGARVAIAVVCRLSKEKGVDTFLSALARVDHRLDIHAVVMGEGPERGQLIRQAESLGLADRVEFVGFVEDAAHLLPQFDFVVIPSRAEGFPLIAVEACAAGRPLLATRVGGLPELIRDGENGWLVEADDVEAMSRAIDTAVRDMELRVRFGAAGYRIFDSQLRAEHMVSRTLAVYQAALATHSGRYSPREAGVAFVEGGQP